MSNLHQYWYWEKVLHKNEIKQLNKFIDKNYDQLELPEKGAKDKFGNFKKNSLVKCILWKKIKNFLEEPYDKIVHTAKYKFGYDIYDVSNLDMCLLNIYHSSKNSEYGWHIDVNKDDLFDVKLTVIINLSLEEFEGGDFKLFQNDEYVVEQLKTPGNMIMFKSQINHCVTPVTKGERRTLTIFIHGPKFR